MTLHEKLVTIQSELKAPKGQTNTFGKYKYRSCEDILEAVKPLLKSQKLVLTLTDWIENVGGRFYVRATATVSESETSFLSVTAYAREEETKKGMDAAQITGAASSYARKYALNGLFCIDDTKDADTMDNTKTEAKPEKPIKEVAKPKPDKALVMESLTRCGDAKGVEAVWKRATRYQWSDAELSDLEECKANVLARIEQERKERVAREATELLGSPSA